MVWQYIAFDARWQAKALEKAAPKTTQTSLRRIDNPVKKWSQKGTETIDRHYRLHKGDLDWLKASTREGWERGGRGF